MPVHLQQEQGAKLVVLKITGKLQHEDYQEFLPVVEERIRQHGKLLMFCELEDFHGWTASALWDDIKFDVKHFNHIDRLAIVGDQKWEAGMAMFCKPFTTAKIKYFDVANRDEAMNWLTARAHVAEGSSPA